MKNVVNFTQISQNIALAILHSKFGITKEKIDLYIMQKTMRVSLEYGATTEFAYSQALKAVANAEYENLLSGDNPLSGSQNTIRDNIQLANMDDLRKCVGYLLAGDVEKGTEAGLDVTEGIFKGRVEVAQRHLAELQTSRHVKKHGVNFILVGEVTN